MVDSLKWFGEWFNRQTDGEWEHVHGVELSTLDNPGWRLKIDLKGTSLEDARFERIELERAKDDWVSHPGFDGDRDLTRGRSKSPSNPGWLTAL
jgi:hypothetical protein